MGKNERTAKHQHILKSQEKRAEALKKPEPSVPQYNPEPIEVGKLSVKISSKNVNSDLTDFTTKIKETELPKEMFSEETANKKNNTGTVVGTHGDRKCVKCEKAKKVKKLSKERKGIRLKLDFEKGDFMYHDEKDLHGDFVGFTKSGNLKIKLQGEDRVRFYSVDSGWERF